MKITNYPLYTNLQPDDLFLVVANVNSDPANKRVRFSDLLSNLNANTAINGSLEVNGDFTVDGDTYFVNSLDVQFTNLRVDNLVVSSNGFIISEKFTPANSAIYEAGSEGKFFYDENYLYIKISDNEVKRVALTSF